MLNCKPNFLLIHGQEYSANSYSTRIQQELWYFSHFPPQRTLHSWCFANCPRINSSIISLFELSGKTQKQDMDTESSCRPDGDIPDPLRRENFARIWTHRPIWSRCPPYKEWWCKAAKSHKSRSPADCCLKDMGYVSLSPMHVYMGLQYLLAVGRLDCL